MQKDLSLHPELAPFAQPGGLFDVPATSEMHINLGRRFVGTGTSCHADYQVMTAVAVQRTFYGTLAYRAQSHPGDFGCPVRPDELVWLSDDAELVTVVYEVSDPQPNMVNTGEITTSQGRLDALLAHLARDGYTVLMVA